MSELGVSPCPSEVGPTVRIVPMSPAHHDKDEAIADALGVKPGVRRRVVEARHSRQDAPEREELCEHASTLDQGLLEGARVPAAAAAAGRGRVRGAAAIRCHRRPRHVELRGAAWGKEGGGAS